MRILNMLVLAATLILGLSLGACDRATMIKAEASAGCPDLQRLDARTASDDAVRQIRAGNIKLFGVHGYALEVPGVRDVEAAQLKYGISKIAGTSDTFSNETCRDLNDRARIYAEKYNKTVIERVH